MYEFGRGHAEIMACRVEVEPVLRYFPLRQGIKACKAKISLRKFVSKGDVRELRHMAQ